MNTSITQTELDAVAASLDPIARERAHAQMVSDSTPEEFARCYMVCLAEVLANQSAEECADGEDWEPTRILDGDRDELEAQAEVLGIELTPSDWKSLRSSYGVTP